MSSAPQFYILESGEIVDECEGCEFIIQLKFGDVGKEICNRHPQPDQQFLFGPCQSKIPSDNEN